MAWRLHPNGELVFYTPPRRDRPPDDKPGTDLEDLVEKSFAEQSEQAATTRGVTGTERIQTDEIIQQSTRVYIGVPTPEEFLDDFSHAFDGFAREMGKAGVSRADLNLMLDPSTGFMQSMLTEYMGNLAERAARGEDIYEVVGVGGAQEFLGTRAGEVTSRETERITRTQAESILRERGQEITNESVTQVIDEETQKQQGATTRTRDETTTTTEDTTRQEIGKTRFEEIEELFRQPLVTPVYKFSPLDFLRGRFENDPGMLTTILRSRKGERQRMAQTLTGGQTAQPRRA